MSIIRPVAMLVLGYGIWNLKRDHIALYRFHFIFALALLGLTIFYVIPFPPAIWQAVSGRNLSAEVAGIAGMSNIWQPISMAPAATWNALSALSVPVAILVLVSQLDRESRFQLLGLFLLIGSASVILGLLQAVGSTDSSLYLYKIRVGNFPTGLFANRNHYAVFLSCMIPMLAVYLSLPKSSSRDNRAKMWLAVAFCALLVPLILVTGSRAGLLTATLAILATPFLYRKQQSASVQKGKAQKFNLSYLVGFFGVAAMALVTIFAARAESFDRLFDDGGSANMRFSIWKPIWDLVEIYGRVGSGAGSFVPVYQRDEPINLLTFQYVPHAHNDWLEVVLTTGWLGGGMVLWAAMAFVLAAWRHFRADHHETRDVMFGRLGIVIIALLIVASAVDYPLRVPSLNSLFVVAAIWAAGSSSRLSKRAGSA